MSQPNPPSPVLRSVPRSQLFAVWARIVLRLRWPVMVSCLLFAAWMGERVAHGLEVDASSEAFLPVRSEAARSLGELRRDFGRDTTLRIVVEGDVFALDFLQRLADLQADLEALDSSLAFRLNASQVAEEDATRGWERGPAPVFERVTSLLNARELRAGPDGSVAYERWLGPGITLETLPLLRTEILADPGLVGHVVDAEGRHAVLVLEPAVGLSSEQLTEVYEATRNVMRLYAADGFWPRVGGLTAIQAAVSEGVLADLSFLLGAEGVVLLLVLWAVFRHPLGVLGPLFVVAQAALSMFGWMSLVNMPLTLVSAVLGALVLCVGIGCALHVQAAYRDARREGLGNYAAVEHAVATTGVPVLFATLTTCLGMLSFVFAQMAPIRQLGLASATGIFFAGLYALTFLPAWLSFNRGSLLGARADRRAGGISLRFLRLCDAASRRSAPRRRAVLAVGVAFLLLAGYGLTRVRAHHDPLAWLPSDTPVALATHSMDEYVGGSSTLSVLVTATDGADIRDPELLQGVRRLMDGAREVQDPASGKPLVKAESSILELLREARAALQLEQDVAAGAGSRGEAVDLLMLWEQLAPEQLHHFVTLDYARLLVRLEVAWRDAASYAHLTESLNELADRHLGAVASVQLTGAAYDMFTVVSALLWDLIRSLSTALLVITLIMMLLLRSVPLGLLVMIPNLWPIVGMLGAMGLSGRAIDIQNVLLASIAMGLVVDDTIHYLHHFRVHFAGYGDVDAAIEYAFERAGSVMLGTSLVLMVGFAVLLLGYMGSTRVFGGFAVLVVALALLADLLLLPALLRSVYRSRPRVYDPERASSYDLTLSEFS